MGWSVEELSKRFRVQADGADDYVRENLERIRRNDPRSLASQAMVDMSSAEAALYGSLSTSAALTSKSALVAELKRLRASGLQPPKEVKDKERYIECSRRLVEMLIKEFDSTP
jgi:hypothetical protein